MDYIIRTFIFSFETLCMKQKFKFIWLWEFSVSVSSNVMQLVKLIHIYHAIMFCCAIYLAGLVVTWIGSIKESISLLYTKQFYLEWNVEKSCYVNFMILGWCIAHSSCMLWFHAHFNKRIVGVMAGKSEDELGVNRLISRQSSFELV